MDMGNCMVISGGEKEVKEGINGDWKNKINKKRSQVLI